MQRYEALRAGALGGEPAGWRLGLALLQGHGVAAWLRAGREVAPIVAKVGDRSASSVRPGGDDLVGVLATMALAALR